MRALKIPKEALNNGDRHDKQWGYELWIENIPEYCGKLLVFKAGGATSMHFHMEKKETMYLQSGRVDIDMIDTQNGTPYTVELRPGDSVHIQPGMPHSIKALQDSELFEFSTTHRNSDSYRLTQPTKAN